MGKDHDTDRNAGQRAGIGRITGRCRAFVNWAIGFVIQYFYGSNPNQNIVTATVVGGTASRLTGGSFSNGAQSSAFSWALNWSVGKVMEGMGVKQLVSGKDANLHSPENGDESDDYGILLEDVSPVASASEARHGEFLDAMDELHDRGLLRGRDVDYVDKFAVADRGGRGLDSDSIELFDTFSEARSRALESGKILLGGYARVGGMGRLTIFAGATLAQRFASGEFQYNLTGPQAMRLIILHEYAHSIGIRSEVLANDYAKTALLYGRRME